MIGYPYIPRTITVHLGAPDSYAQNVTVSFPDYIKNVASSEIYPTWPENALRANIYAQVSVALNRVYTEWYRSRGYDFDITSSTQYDQYFVKGRDIFENISKLVDELFNDYIRRQGYIEPLFAQFCNGTTVTCDGLSQWGSVTLAKQGKTPYEILTRYYGNDIDLVFNAPIQDITPSYPGSPLRNGSRGTDVRLLQVRLNRISKNYPAIPKISPVDGIFGDQTESAVRKFQQIFNLTSDGIVGKRTWYRIAYIYASVTRLAQLYSEGTELVGNSLQYTGLLREGDQGNRVRVLQYMLALLSQYNQEIPWVSVDGIFGPRTRSAVLSFQQTFGLSPDGVVGPLTWDRLYRTYASIINSPYYGEEAVAAPYPGSPLSIGSSGSSVSLLQQYLGLISSVYTTIPQVPVTGYFGEITKNAVRIFQSEAGLTVDGIVGPATWNAIANTYENLLNGAVRNPGQFPGYTLREGM